MISQGASLQVKVGSDIRDATAGLRKVNSMIGGTGALFGVAAASALGFVAAALRHTRAVQGDQRPHQGTRQRSQGMDVATMSPTGRAGGLVVPPTPRMLRLPHIERGDVPELRQMGQRLTRWRLAYPDVWARFWSVEGAHCIVCGRTTPDFIKALPDGTGEAHLACFPAPGSAAHRALNMGGVDAVWYQPIEPGEVWAAWCPTCPTPRSDAEVELMAAAVQRRAAGAA